MHRAHLALLLLALPACDGVDNELNKEREENDDVSVMVVDPGYLDFGGLGTGESAQQTFEIRNEGGIPLDVSEVRIEGAAAFSLLSTATGVIAPGEARTVTVEYRPTNLTDTATIRIFGDDPQNPEDQVELTGAWVLPVLAISPSPYDYGPVPFGCLTGKTVALENIGSDTLVIDSIVLQGTGYSIPEYPPLPLSIEPGESHPLQILFEAPSADVSVATLWVNSNDPSGVKTSSQSGWGIDGDCIEVEVPEDQLVDIELSFTVETGLADIAFALDTTSSMSGLALAMASEFRNIVADLSDTFEDATYGVATYDDYAMQPFGAKGTDLPFILRQQQTEDTAAVQRALSSEVVIHYGDDTPESTMEALYQGLTGAGYDQNCNGEYNDDSDVLPFASSAMDPFGGTGGEAQDTATPGTGDIGGFGFRENMLPIIIYATDAPLRDADDTVNFSTPGGCPGDAGASDVANAANALNAKLIGVGVNMGRNERGYTQMGELAAATGSYADLDGDGALEPAVVTWSGTSSDFRQTIVDAVVQLVAALSYESIELVAADDTLGFVHEISPSIYYNVATGETVTFTVTLEGVLPAEPYEQANQLTFYLIGDGTTLLHTYTVTVITPSL
jgi:hypothetical protein